MPQTCILGSESADVLHLLGHHILGDVILPEQTCRVKGGGELTPGQVLKDWRGKSLEGPELPHSHLALTI